MDVVFRYSDEPWLGLSDLHSLGVFRWITGAVTLWNNWATNRPVNSTYSCVAWVNGFYDDNCLMNRSFICQNVTGD